MQYQLYYIRQCVVAVLLCVHFHDSLLNKLAIINTYCKDSGYFSNKNDVYCSAGNMQMNTCANVANKNLETISCNTRYKHVLHVV